MEDFIQDIYEKGLALDLLKKVSFYSNMRHVFNRRDYWNDATNYLEKIIYDLRDLDLQKATEILGICERIQKSFNNRHQYVGLIDMELIPKIMDYMKRFTGINVTDDGWTLLSSQTGFLTLKDETGGYVHSISDPMWEAFLYAYSIFDPATKRYNILGGGLGYLAYQLWKMSDEKADIYVYEVDESIATYAEMYGVISWIDNEKIHYITGGDTDIIIEEYLDIPEIKTIKTIYNWNPAKYHGEYEKTINILFTDELTEKVFENKWLNNISLNKGLEHREFSEIEKKSFCDEWLVVGAGPSLSENEEFIRESIGKRTICTVNSALKWFHNHGIKPDLCTASDPQDDLITHIKGYEDVTIDVPLISDLVANSGFVELYKGPKYYIYSKIAADLSRDDIPRTKVWSYGGTVASLALEVAQRFMAKKIYLIGTDLSYPGGVSHAAGVGHEVKKILGRPEEMVISIDDIIVPTSHIFEEYRQVIEGQIADYPSIEVVNRSFHGAYIKGSYCGQWWENIPDSEEFSDYREAFENILKDSYILGWNEKYYVFHQLLHRMKLHNVVIDEEGKDAVEKAYESIYKAFKEELKWEKPIGENVNKSHTYIITDDFQGVADHASKRVLELAESEARKKNNVLIVNTAERLGGEKVAIHEATESGYNTEMEKSDRVIWKNYTFSYFQFPKGMPKLNYYSAFFDSIAPKKPGKLIFAGEYSLFADYCSEALKIPLEKAAY